MVNKGIISPRKRAIAIHLREKCKWSIRDTARKCGISKSSVQRLSGDIGPRRSAAETGKRKGRPRQVNDRDMRVIIRTVNKLRTTNFDFSVKKVVHESGFNFLTASERTFSRRLNEKGYFFLQARKKGLLMEKDKKSRLAYARKMKQIQVSNPGYWCNDVAFYQDGVSFIHKTNPMSAALSPKARVWRK